LLQPALWSLDVLEVSTAGQWFMPLRERPTIRVGAAYGLESPAHQRDEHARTLSRSGGAALAAGRLWRNEHQELAVRAAGIDIQQTTDVALPEGGTDGGTHFLVYVIFLALALLLLVVHPGSRNRF
jgi:hypothetical protein